ncbi:MAG: O-antigen ligase family protein [Patescibacteria group bacterium]
MPLLLTLYIFFFAYLTYRSARLALSLLIVLLPSYLIRFTVFGVPFTLLEVSIWTVAITWFFLKYQEHQGLPLPRPSLALSESNPFRPYFFPILLWLLVATVSVVISPNLFSALGIWKAYFIEPLLVFAIFVVEFRGTPERHWPVYALGIAALAIALGAWFQKVTGLFIPEPYALAESFKVTSFFSYPNAVGLFLAPVIALYGTWVLYSAKHGSRLLWLMVVFLFGLVAIVFSVTKGAWVGVVVGILFGAFLALTGSRRVILVGVATLALIAIFVVPPTRVALLNQVTLHSPSGKMRIVVWQETLALLRDHPIVGSGLAGYQSALVPYHQEWRHDVSPYKLEIFLYPHNVFLNAWTELGVAGLLVFVWLLGAFFHTAWQRRGQALSIAAMAAMVALLVHGLVDVPYFKNDLSILFWVIMAIPLLESRRVHVLNVGSESYNQLMRGLKRVEARLFDRQQRDIQVGDLLLCYPHHNTYECMRAEVIEVTPRPSFTELLAAFHPAELGFDNHEHGMAVLRERYSEEDENYLGVVGIRLRPLN